MNASPLVTATAINAATVVAHLDDLPIGSMKMVRVDDHRLCLVRTSDGVFALDHACPHEGYGMTQGSLDANLITCAWHNWKFRVDDGACVVGEEDIATHHATIDDDGAVRVTLTKPDLDTLRPRLLASLRRGVERDYIGQVSRDVVRLLQADTNPGELVWEAVDHGAPRAEFGWGHSIASATDCLAMVDLYEGDQRALPIVQAIAGIAEAERDRPVNPLPDPTSRLPAEPLAEFRRAVESEQLEQAQALVRGAIHSGHTALDLRPWFTAVASDHLLSYGHGAIYCQKAFELLDLIGWQRADTVLPYLVPTIVYGTREDLLPYTRPFMRALDGVDLTALSTLEVDDGWRDDGTLLTTLLGSDRKAIVPAVIAAMRSGAGVDGVLDVVVETVSERMMRYDLTGERDLLDDFGWLDITHGLTYANAARSAPPQFAGSRHGAPGDVHRLSRPVDRSSRMAHQGGRTRQRPILRGHGRRGRPGAATRSPARQRIGVHRLRPWHQDQSGSVSGGCPQRLGTAVAGGCPPARFAPIGEIRRCQRGSIDRVPGRTGAPRSVSDRTHARQTAR